LILPREALLRVVLTGSECTGKTTLASELAEHYRTVWVPEQARVYLEAKGAPLVYADVEAIARAVITAQEEAAPRADRLLILDTDLLSTVVYSRAYYGDCPPWVEAAARERRGHLYLLHHPDVPWVPDGLQRDIPDRREHMHALFREALESGGARYFDIRGGWEERRNRARRAIDALRAGPL
jgi:NadR type nicotinamide-nucleotide adenylyltransferase